MLLQDAKKRLIIRALLVLLLMLAGYGIFFVADKRQIKSQERLTWLKNDINNLRTRISNLDQKTSQLTKAVELWETLSDEQKEAAGLRINEGTQALNKFKQKFYLNKVDATFSKPQALEAPYKIGNATVMASDLVISMAAVTDSLALEFIEALQKEFPGNVLVRSVALKQGGVLDKGHLKEISTGTPPGLISGDIQALWRDIIYNPPVAAGAGENNSAPAAPGSPTAPPAQPVLGGRAP
jgi:hypothetical protein